ncbi:GNAT family N-acetyltransferase, partial [Streptomyces sp. OF1]|nr:GNAT family N-acetyltransferase [Streptomyces alkaliterrae]
MTGGAVELRRLDEDLLGALLETAVRDAEPAEVMPPVAGPPGWTRQRREAFLRFHRERPRARPKERVFAVVVDGAVVGAARLDPVADEPGAVEIGVWLGRSVRGRGLASLLLEELVEQARGMGARHLVASTTVSNPAARRALASLGADMTQIGDTTVTAHLLLTPAA